MVPPQQTDSQPLDHVLEARARMKNRFLGRLDGTVLCNLALLVWAWLIFQDVVHNFRLTCSKSVLQRGSHRVSIGRVVGWVSVA